MSKTMLQNSLSMWVGGPRFDPTKNTGKTDQLALFRLVSLLNGTKRVGPVGTKHIKKQRPLIILKITNNIREQFYSMTPNKH